MPLIDGTQIFASVGGRTFRAVHRQSVKTQALQVEVDDGEGVASSVLWRSEVYALLGALLDWLNATKPEVGLVPPPASPPGDVQGELLPASAGSCPARADNAAAHPAPLTLPAGVEAVPLDFGGCWVTVDDGFTPLDVIEAAECCGECDGCTGGEGLDDGR